MGGRWRKPLWGGSLTLEKYHRFFVDPWKASITNDQLNHIISMHGFVKLHRFAKRKIMNHLVGQVDLQPPRRSTLHTGARLSAANIAAEQAVADVDAIGWTECPIGCMAVFAGFGEGPAEPLEPMPPPADHVLSLAVRRARSKRTRGSAYPRRAASEKAKVKEEDLEEGEIWPPPPPPPPPPRPQTVVPHPPSSLCRRQPKLEPIISSPPPPGFGSPPPPGFGSPPPPGFGSPPSPGYGSPLPPCWSRPTLAPLPPPPPGSVSQPPPRWSRPTLAPLLPTPSSKPMVPPPSGLGAQPTFTYHRQPAGPPPLLQLTAPPSYPGPCRGAPSVLPPPQAAWRWPHPPPRWAPPHMQQQWRPPPPWGCMRPPAPPPLPPQHPPRLEKQQHTLREVIYF